MKNYEMITVKDYVKELSEKEKYVLTTVEEYLKKVEKEEHVA